MVRYVYNHGMTRSYPKSEDPLVDLCILLDQTTDIVFQAVTLEISPLNLTFPQLKVLTILTRNKKEASIHELSKWLLREFNSVSTLINRMEQKGLVKKIKKEGEKRTYVKLTEKGARLYEDGVTMKSTEMIFECLSESEQKKLEQILKKVSKKTRDILGLDFKPSFFP